MCGPAAPVAGAGLLAGGTTTAALSAAGPGMMFATAAPTVAGASALAPLGASFASSAPFSLGSLFSGIGIGDAISVLSPLASAFQSITTAGDLAELGRIQTEAANMQLTQDMIEQRTVELERRERASQEIAGLLAGGQSGQSLVALTRKRLDDNARAAQLSETRFGAIGVRETSRIAAQDRRTKTAINTELSRTGQGVGRAGGFLAERFS
jgi:hypothetical protein